MATSFLGTPAVSPALLPLLGSAAILSFDYFEAIYFSTFIRAPRAEMPDGALSAFWKYSLTPSLTSVFVIYGGTAALGAAAWSGAEKGGLLRKYAGLGALFTAGHFLFGYPIAKTVERLVEEPVWAREGQRRWLIIHAVRTMTADIPGFICFLAAVYHGW